MSGSHEVLDVLATVGHSNRCLADFMALLTAANVEALVDIRRHPQSQHHPQFNQAALRQSLAAEGIRYDWAGRHLGGFRRVRKDSPHCALPRALRAYADHMESAEFELAVRQLIDLSRRCRVVLMCAERDPAQCHRSLLADFLEARGETVVHLLRVGFQLPHQLSAQLRITGGALVYDMYGQTELPGLGDT